MTLSPNKSRFVFRSLRSTLHCWSLLITARHGSSSCRGKQTRRGIIIQSSYGRSAACKVPTQARGRPSYLCLLKQVSCQGERNNQIDHTMSEIWQAPSLVFQKMPLSAILASAELSPPRSHAPSNIKSPRTTPTRRSLRHDCEAPRSWAGRLSGNVMSS